MTLREKKYLSDILVALNTIAEVSDGISSFNAYKNNILIKAAIERFLAIAGEAASKYQKLNPETKLIHSEQIISLRNRLVHAYDNIDDRIIWVIVKKHIIPLKTEVEKLLVK